MPLYYDIQKYAAVCDNCLKLDPITSNGSAKFKPAPSILPKDVAEGIQCSNPMFWNINRIFLYDQKGPLN